MNLKQRIDTDIKTAMLAGDKRLVTALRTLKSAILYAEVAAGVREQGIDDASIVTLLQKELKKRQESAALFSKGGNQQKAEDELWEIGIIEQYLPSQLSDEELDALVETALGEVEGRSQQVMGAVIARVRELSEGRADGGRIARAVKGKLE